MAVDKTRNDGRFRAGNPGKPIGTLSWAKRKVAVAAGELFEEAAPEHFRKIFDTKQKATIGLLRLRQDAIEFLADRAYGKAPITVRSSIDPDSPEGVLLKIAGQVIPGLTGEDSGSE